MQRLALVVDGVQCPAHDIPLPVDLDPTEIDPLVRGRPDKCGIAVMLPWTRTGASFTTISRDTFVARLAALVPPPRFNMVRYCVLASRHHLRARVAPKSEPLDLAPHQLPLFVVHTDAELAAFTTAATTSSPPERAPSRIAWASLLARVFDVDVTVCAMGPCALSPPSPTPTRSPSPSATPRGPPRPRPDPPGQTLLFE